MKCQHCGKAIGGYLTSRRKFCDDRCRVAWHRAGGTIEKRLAILEKQYAIQVKKLKIVPDSQYERALAVFQLVKDELINLQNSQR